MTYRETLHRWAVQHLPEGVKDPRVTSVEIKSSEGGAWSEVTFEGSLWVTIHYTAGDTKVSYLRDGDEAVRVLAAMGELLTELFAIEDEGRR